MLTVLPHADNGRWRESRLQPAIFKKNGGLCPARNSGRSACRQDQNSYEFNGLAARLTALFCCEALRSAAQPAKLCVAGAACCCAQNSTPRRVAVRQTTWHGDLT